ncbi:MAG: LysM peptidoglycan-binding domain-containing protein [Muribaculaceae bacterium]|nr:LysM peptidoglycan-binding domain-containing protein [Muribaculaceae bacterium]
MKRFITVMCVVLLSVSVVFAQEITHKVKKHETIASIAKTYGVSSDDLLNANPTLKSRMYVGMVLNIPVAKTAEVSQPKKSAEPKIKQKESRQTVTQKSEPKIVQSEIREDKIKVKDENNAVDENEVESEFTRRAGKGGVNMEMFWGFLENPHDMYDWFGHGSLMAHFKYKYYLHDNIYAGIGLGFGWSVFDTDEDKMEYDMKQTCWFVPIPIEIGLDLAPQSKIALIPSLGLNANICVSEETEIDSKKKKNKMGGEVGLEGRIGLALRLSEGFAIKASYNTPFSDENKAFFGEDGYLTIGFVSGF